MPNFYYDIETRSTIDLTVVGAHRYAADPTTEVLCVGFAVNDRPVEIWTPGQPIPEPAIEAAHNPDWSAIAHNAGFDRPIVEWKLHPQFGWLPVPLERHRCTMVKALAAALPAALGKAIEALGLPYPKDKAGAALMRRMARPKPGGGWIDDPASLERLYQYLRRDVEAARALDRALPSLTEDEQRLWELDAIINSRGFHTDGALLEAAHQVVTATEAKLQAEFRELTGLDSTNQTQKFIAWLAAAGCIVTDAQKGTLRHALRRKELAPEVRRAIELRLELAHASVAKVEALRAWRGDDGRVRGTLQYHGAATGRWVGRGPQPQNLRRDGADIDAKIAAVMNGGAGLASPVEAVGDIARAMICAAPGHRLLIGDYSGIESRVLAWASRQQSKIDQWKRFDETGDPNDDPYVLIGRSIGHPEATARAYGKICDLAFGYQGGVGAWQNFAPEGDTSSEEAIKCYRDTWRRQHPATERFWYALDRAAVRAVARPATDQRCDRFVFRFDAPFLRISLPSGRALSYPFPRIETGKYGSQLVMFLDNAGGKFVDCRFGHGSYGGLWTENIVSGIARDLLAAALTRLEAAGYPVVLHVHDEIVCEVPDGFGTLDEFKRLVTEVPTWAEGLPIAAKVRNGPRFSKAENEGVSKSTTPAENAPAAFPGASFVRTNPEFTDPPPSNGTPWDDPLADIYASATINTDPPPAPPPPPQSPPPPPPEDEKPARGNGHGDFNDFEQKASGSKAKAAHDTYAEEHADEPFSDTYLQTRGYRLATVFKYTLPDGTPLYRQNRYELRPEIAPTKKKPRKRFLPHRTVNGKELFGAGDRHVIYNWPGVMQAGPGSTVLVTEGETNADACISKGLLATTVLSHKWTPECVAALTGYHIIIPEDHDDDGCKLGANVRTKLAPVAASIRVVPTARLWKHLPAGHRAIKIHDDVKDWLELGGDPAKLIDICCEIPAEGIITAEPYRFPEEQKIAPWQWLYGQHLLRGEVAGTVAMGGTGKSSKSIVEALAMASGRALLGEQVSPLRIVLINLEDTRNTLDKRIAAAMKHYVLTPADIGDRLIVKAKGEVKIKVARQLRSGDVARDEAVVGALTRLMIEHKADVLSIDSFIRTHRVNENDNSAIEEVVECFESIATEAQCAVHLWHHTRKGGGEKATIESARGAIAFVDACRSARIMETMSAKEHAELKAVQPEMMLAGYYFRSFNGKRNFAPPADQSDWFKLESIMLRNSDNVGVVTPWQYPEIWADLSAEVANRILDEIDAGLPNGQRYSNRSAAKDRAAWQVIQLHCPNKPQGQCRQIIAMWMESGALYEDDYDDPKNRKVQKGLFVRNEKRPT
jgi:DNA polymerase